MNSLIYLENKPINEKKYDVLKIDAEMFRYYIGGAYISGVKPSMIWHSAGINPLSEEAMIIINTGPRMEREWPSSAGSI